MDHHQYIQVTMPVLSHSPPIPASVSHQIGKKMAAQGLDLNAEPPIDWDQIGDWDGPANELDYAMVWSDEGTC
jgi:hypothetical protein